tara:strand:+ start:240 stop:701 length:462 start_codon:yes stop_codon:yes gene_type:complete
LNIGEKMSLNRKQLRKLILREMITLNEERREETRYTSTTMTNYPMKAQQALLNLFKKQSEIARNADDDQKYEEAKKAFDKQVQVIKDIEEMLAATPASKAKRYPNCLKDFEGKLVIAFKYNGIFNDEDIKKKTGFTGKEASEKMKKMMTDCGK